MFTSPINSHHRFRVRQLQRLIAAGQLTSEQICQYCWTLAHAGEEIWRLHAFQTLLPFNDVIEQAQKADEARRKYIRSSSSSSPVATETTNMSLLHGLPVSLKANLAVSSLPLTAGSRILGEGSKQRSNLPAIGYDADVTKALLLQQQNNNSGMILLGVTTMDEFGMGSLGTNVVGIGNNETNEFQPTKNPLPYLRELHKVIDELINKHNSTSLNNDDERTVQIISLPQDTLWEAHEQALQRMSDANHHPHHDFSTGGSSCGSAASVAHGSSLVSLGSDTGGSVRLPAAWCGITGLKPTYGLLSRYGLVAYASSLDTVGILAPSADCVKLTLQQLVAGGSSKLPAGEKSRTNRRDATLCIPPESFLASLEADEPDEKHDKRDASPPKISLNGLKIGIPAAFSIQECPERIRTAWALVAELLQQCGVSSIEVVDTDILSVDVIQRSLAAYYVLVSAEASSNLARYDGFRYGVSAARDNDDSLALEHQDECDSTSDRWSLLERQYAATRTHYLGTEVKRRILCGTSCLSADKFHAYYEAAAHLRAILTEQMDAANVDVWLLPTSLSVLPPKWLNAKDDHGQTAVTNVMNPTEMFANDVLTVPFSLAGLPTVALPILDTNQKNSNHNDMDDQNASMFVPSFQLVGKRFGEPTILRAAQAIQALQEQQRLEHVCTTV